MNHLLKRRLTKRQSEPRQAHAMATGEENAESDLRGNERRDPACLQDPCLDDLNGRLVELKALTDVCQDLVEDLRSLQGILEKKELEKIAGASKPLRDDVSTA